MRKVRGLNPNYDMSVSSYFIEGWKDPGQVFLHCGDPDVIHTHGLQVPYYSGAKHLQVPDQGVNDLQSSDDHYKCLKPLSVCEFTFHTLGHRCRGLEQTDV
jgi:hypothetical protein